MPKPFQITFDAHDTMAQAAFWAETLGYILQPPPDGFATCEQFASEVGIPEEEWGDLAAAVDPEGIQPRLLFARVPEDKVVKNRVHLDVNVTDPSMALDTRRTTIDAEVERLTVLGATKVEDRGDTTHTWTVMTDPEGNEFCVQ